jgi:1-acyl-sn-glycerol-3-phosphate acyltransferase
MQLHLRQHFSRPMITGVSHLRRKLPSSFLKNTSVSSELINSAICPRLSKIIYPVGAYGVLPWFFGELKVSGVENIPHHDPVILAPTHRSRWDGILVTFAAGRLTTGRDLHYMVSADELTGIQGWLIKKMGGFPVNTLCPKIGSFRHSVDLLQQNQCLVMFPEGDIFTDGKVHNLKRGLARIALQVAKKQAHSKVKVIPIGINYSDPVPTWGTNVHIRIGEALEVRDYTQATMKMATANLTLDVQCCLKELSDK